MSLVLPAFNQQLLSCFPNGVVVIREWLIIFKTVQITDGYYLSESKLIPQIVLR